MYKYTNVSNSVQTITASGDIRPRVVEPGGEMLTDLPIENPNFKFIGKSEPGGIVGTATSQPAMVTDAQKLETKEQE